MAIWMVFAIVIFIILMFLPFGRELIKELTSSSALKIYSYILVVVKYIISAHKLMFRNLMYPRKVILPSLENDDRVNMK